MLCLYRSSVLEIGLPITVITIIVLLIIIKVLALVVVVILMVKLIVIVLFFWSLLPLQHPNFTVMATTAAHAGQP